MTRGRWSHSVVGRCRDDTGDDKCDSEKTSGSRAREGIDRKIYLFLETKTKRVSGKTKQYQNKEKCTVMRSPFCLCPTSTFESIGRFLLNSAGRSCY
jgi:hypothetical protein